ncbi:MAG: amidohydrolase/deacetylase family metallohydrolase [Acidobacteria bacterium]|nr:amidohydrolase/deacetylase family metallohydrolase [Acidobacteriota bacterium]
MRRLSALIFLILLGSLSLGAQTYDLLLKGGHVIDPKNGLSAQRDVAISSGKVAAVAEQIAAGQAKQTIDVSGLYVTPGFVDLHTHIVMGSGLKGTLPVEQNVYVDSHTLRSGVTTAVDAGTTGWRNFPDFKKKIIDFVSTDSGYVRTRVLALLNIVGHGEAGEKYEQDANDMDAKATAAAAQKYKDFIVGIKTAHYQGPEWVAVDRAVEAGTLADIPIMVDFGAFRPERPFEELVLDHLRPGDMYTHTYHGSVPMLDDKGKVRDYLFEARRRGVKFDVGHGAGSFWWRQAVPAVRQGFLPDSISTDLHVISMNAGMKDMTNVMSKFLNLGVPLEKVIEMSTVAPAKQIKRPELGHLSVGAVADIAVLRIEQGKFGFLDVRNARLDGTKRLRCELTLREGVVVWDLNGLAGEDWQKFYAQP